LQPPLKPSASIGSARFLHYASTMTSNGTKGHATHMSNDAFGHVVPLLIDGKEVTTETTFDVTSPVTNKVIWRSSSVSKDDAIKAVEAAQAAFPAWSKTKPSRRRDILLKASDILAQRAEEAAEYMEIETGAVPAYSGGFNVPSAIEQLKDVAGRIITSTGSVPVCAEEGKSAMIVKEPYGVIFGIAPWFVVLQTSNSLEHLLPLSRNAPYILGFRAVSYALAAGNTCVLKGPEFSPRCYWLIGTIFKEAGLPDGWQVPSKFTPFSPVFILSGKKYSDSDVSSSPPVYSNSLSHIPSQLQLQSEFLTFHPSPASTSSSTAPKMRPKSQPQ